MLRFLLSVAIGASPLLAQGTDLTGRWLGTLDAGGAKLRLAFHFTRDPAGGWKGTMDSLDQGVNGIPLGKVLFEGNQVNIEIPAVHGTYVATLAASGGLEGKWSQGGVALPLTVVRSAAGASSKRPQEPTKPYPYQEVEVSYENSAQKVKLAGTLTVPKDAKKSPAVILITGSGPQNRDEELMGHKPFLVLSDALTRKGIAVLRVDDRGVGGSTGNPRSTTLDFATDVAAGIEFLKTRPEIDPKRIGLVGHSEGGLIAPIVAAQSKDVWLIVMMAGTGVPGEEILYEQGSAIIKANGASADTARANVETQKKIFAILKAEPDDTEARKKIESLLSESVTKLPEEQRMRASAAIKAQAAGAANPWFRTFLGLDPAVYLRKVTCPVLALNGELDLQVLANQNLPAIEKALKEGGNKDYTIKRFGGLNHLFQTAKTGSPSEYSSIDETISPAVLNTIATWILDRTQKR